MSKAEIESLRNSNQTGFLGDVIMEPEGGVEIRADFLTTKDELEVFLFLPMTKEKYQDFNSNVDYLEMFHRVNIGNSYKARQFVWEQAQKRIQDLNDKIYNERLPTRSQRRRARAENFTMNTPPLSSIHFEMDSVVLIPGWKTSNEFGHNYGTAKVLKNEKRRIIGGNQYTLDAIVSAEEADYFVDFFSEFAEQF
jgi:hypothetical protein